MADRKISKKQITLISVISLLIAVGILVVFLVMQPERSVASFCRVAKEEKSVLVGDIPYEKRLDSYKKLEIVSPDDIRPDISTIRKGYEEIVKNPSNTLGAGFGMSGAESRRTTYINANCKDF